MDCSNAVKQGMKQPGDVDAAALLDLALDEIAAVNDKEVGKPPCPPAPGFCFGLSFPPARRVLGSHAG